MANSYDAIYQKYSSKIKVMKLLNRSAVSLDAKALKTTLENGLSTDQTFTTERKSLLHLAAGIKHEETSLSALKIILQYSPTPNLPDGDGNTSLHVAASLNHRHVLRLLVYNGGDLLQCTRQGETAIDVAYRKGHTNLATYLSRFLDSEDHDGGQEDKFSKYLLNRKILDVSPDFKTMTLISASCSLCKEDFFTEKADVFMKNISDSSSTDMFHEIIDQSLASRRKSSICKNKTKKMKTCEPTVKLRSHMAKCYQTLKRTSPEISQDESLEDFVKRSLTNIGVSSFASDKTSSSESSLSNTFCNTSSNSYGTALSILRSTGSLFITVAEEYLYIDKEMGIELIEERFLASSTYSGCFDTLSTDKSQTEEGHRTCHSKRKRSIDSIGTLSKSIDGLSGEELRRKLKELGYNAGPITPSTFRVLQRHLQRLRMKPKLNNSQSATTFSRELENLCTNPSMDRTYEDSLERKMSEPFIAANISSRWRNGTQKTCFNYLLLDPRVAKNLSMRKYTTKTSDLFREFLASVFYIGKGSRTRPFYHFYEALSDSSKAKKNKAKVEKIKEIWNDGFGVISLHIFQNIIPVEAWTREAAMITAIGVNNLTNSVQGSFYGPASTWCKKDQRRLGSFCLLKGFNILLLEGERQISPRDIPPSKWI